MIGGLRVVFLLCFLIHLADFTVEDRKAEINVRQILWKISQQKCKSAQERYDNRTKKCQLLGSLICPENERFFASDDHYGYCDCDNFHEMNVVYYPNTDKCYRLLSQGPCNETEWLEWDSNRKRAICLPAKCQNDGRHVLWTDGRCYRLETQGPCQRYHILMRKNSPKNIICQEPAFFVWINVPIVKNCRQGSRMRYMKKCFS